MKFQSALLSEARGKLNGAVFSRNRYANIIRNKTSPVQPNTDAQTLQRQNFSALSASFRALGANGIAAWNAAAQNWPRSNVFGQTYYQSGLNLYVGLNTNLLNAESAEISVPPSPAEIPVITATVASNTAAAQTVGFTPTPVGAGYALIIAATAPVSPGRTFLKNRYRIISVQAAAATSPANTYTAYVAKFGAPITGQKIGFKIYLINTATGQAGIPVFVDSVTA